MKTKKIIFKIFKHVYNLINDNKDEMGVFEIENDRYCVRGTYIGSYEEFYSLNAEPYEEPNINISIKLITVDEYWKAIDGDTILVEDIKNKINNTLKFYNYEKRNIF